LRILLDTHAFLFWVYAPERVGPSARQAIADRTNQIFWSVASSWEVAIKGGLGKLRLDGPVEEVVPAELLDQGFALLPIDHADVLAVANLPRIHGDPFDRLLVAQARGNSLTLASADRRLRDYGIPVIW